jgi:hypothetical protein
VLLAGGMLTGMVVIARGKAVLPRLALARRSRDLLEVVIGFTWLALRSRSKLFSS